jgi:hypothetical protein
VNYQSDFRAYLKAILETPIDIVLFLLDVAGFVAVIHWVVDDWSEGAVVAVFVLVMHIGHYLIFRKQRGVIAKLRDRIAELEGKHPDLDLFFWHDGKATRHRVIDVLPLPQEPNLDELVRVEAEQLEIAFRGSRPEANGSLGEALEKLSALGAGILSKRHKSAEVYKKESDSYLEQYRQYHQYQHLLELWGARFRKTGFSVKNGGRVPAGDIVIIVHFPDEFVFPVLDEIADAEEDYRNPPAPPARPDPYEYPLAGLSNLTHIRDYPGLLAQVDLPGFRSLGSNPNVSGPSIDREDSTKVNYDIQKLNHGFTEELDEVGFLVTEEATERSWELPYSIHASELPEPIEGTLLLDVHMVESEQ